jgi:hypothetical protein
MSYEERGQWVYIIVNVLTFGAYAAILLSRAQTTPLTEVDYVPLMVWAIAIAIALSIAGRILIEIVRPSESYVEDVRDRDIGRFGEYLGGSALAIAMIIPFALTLARSDHFWIANAMYLAFALASLIGTTVKLVAYRRGF